MKDMVGPRSARKGTVSIQNSPFQRSPNVVRALQGKLVYGRTVWLLESDTAEKRSLRYQKPRFRMLIHRFGLEGLDG